MKKIELGRTYQDRVTGFKGVATGYVQYLTGCNQGLLVPKVGADGKATEGMWYDEQRLELVPDVPRIVLENGSTPGPDKPAPKR